MGETRLMKDGLGPAAVDRIANGLQAAWREFPSGRFRSLVLDGLNELELKQRVHHVIDAMHSCLPDSFANVAPILEQIPDLLDRGDPDDNLRGFAAWPIIDYVGVHGRDHPATALPLLKTLTPLFSAEFAIRPFIKDAPEATIARLAGWTDDPDPHVRRLVSEGTRPRLPWGERLDVFIVDPTPIIPLLKSLRDDPSEYVRRSVANNLNDIAKDHPGVVVELGRSWLRGAPEDRRRLVRHALRTLVKDGRADVFELLGYPIDVRLEAVELSIREPGIDLGGSLEFDLSIRNGKKDQRLVLDYAIHFVKADGRRQPKVFKLRDIELQAGETFAVRKRHPLKQITTRRYYSGEHLLAVHVNGREVARAAFRLTI